MLIEPAAAVPVGGLPADPSAVRACLAAVEPGRAFTLGALCRAAGVEARAAAFASLDHGSLQPAQPGDGAAAASCRAFNRRVLAMARYHDRAPYLANPATAGGYRLDRPERLFLLAARCGLDTPSGWAGYAARHLLTPSRELPGLTDRAGRFADRRAMLHRLGIG